MTAGDLASILKLLDPGELALPVWIETEVGIYKELSVEIYSDEIRITEWDNLK